MRHAHKPRPDRRARKNACVRAVAATVRRRPGADAGGALRRHRLWRPARPRHRRRHRADDRRAFPRRDHAGLGRLGGASGGLARQAGAAGAKGRAQDDPLSAPCGGPRPIRVHRRRRRRAVHRPAAAGQAVRGRSLAQAAVQPDVAELSAHAAMVAQRHHRRARRLETARARGGVHGPAGARHAVAVELPAHQPRTAGAHPRRGRHEPCARLSASGRGLGADDRRQARPQARRRSRWGATSRSAPARWCCATG